jgi:hypothetical protein
MSWSLGLRSDAFPNEEAASLKYTVVTFVLSSPTSIQYVNPAALRFILIVARTSLVEKSSLAVVHPKYSAVDFRGPEIG